jgi:hypothetical protein
MHVFFKGDMKRKFENSTTGGDFHKLLLSTRGNFSIDI